MKRVSKNREDSAARARQEDLTRELGLQMGLPPEKASSWLWAKLPNELVRSMMDLPPEDEERRADWKPMPGRAHDRVLACYIWQSWCYPICMPYAVVTYGHEDIQREKRTQMPILFTQEAVGEMLGMSQQRVAVVTQDLVDYKRVRIEVPGGRKLGHAVFPNPQAIFTDAERKFLLGTVVGQGIEGPRLEPRVYRAFSKLLSQLGEDNRMLSVPAQEDGKPPETMTVKNYRTAVWRGILDIRTQYLEAWKKVKYSEGNGYSYYTTRTRNLIVPDQPSDILSSSSSGAPANPVPARAPLPSDDSASETAGRYTEPTTTTAKDAPAKDAAFYARVTEIFQEWKKGSPGPKQLAAAWKLMPADAELVDFENFLLKPAGTCRMKRIESAAILLTVTAEFVLEWKRGAKSRAEDARRQTEADTRSREDADQHQAESEASERKRQHLLEHPEDCQFCHGAGRFNTNALPAELRPAKPTMRLCSCPAGEKKAAALGRKP